MSPQLRLPPAAVRPALRVRQRAVFDADAPWARQRRGLELVGRTTRVRRGTTVTASTHGAVPTETLRAAGAEATVVVVHFHGGGYTTGTPAVCRAWASLVSEEARATVVLPHYRLAPEAPAPAATDDARAVWDDVVSRVPAARVVVSGDSAAAGIALALTQALVAEASPPPAGMILISPWLDLTVDRSQPADLARRDCLLTPSWLAACAAAYAGSRSAADAVVSPLHGTLAGLPPALVQAATDDVLISDADRFVVDARAAGGDVTYSRAPGLWHDYPIQTGLVAASDAAAHQAATFVDRCCRRPTSG